MKCLKPAILCNRAKILNGNQRHTHSQSDDGRLIDVTQIANEPNSENKQQQPIKKRQYYIDKSGTIC